MSDTFKYTQCTLSIQVHVILNGQYVYDVITKSIEIRVIYRFVV